MNLRTAAFLWLAALLLATSPRAHAAQPPTTNNEVLIKPGDTNAEALLRDALRRALNPPTNNTGVRPSIPMSAPPATNRSVTGGPQRFAPGATNPPAATPAVPEFPAFPTTSPAPPSAPATTIAKPAGTNATPTAKVPAARSEAVIQRDIPGKDEAFDISVLQFQVMPLEQFLEFYSKVVGRTILRPASLPDVKITVKVVNQLTRGEVAHMLDHVLALNGITTVPVGDKFITVVTAAQGPQEAGKISSAESKDLPEAAQFITQVVQLKYVAPSLITPIITPFAKTPGAIIQVEANGVLVIRDYAINVKRIMELIEKVDVQSSQDITQELIPIRYALAADIAGVLGSLTGSGGGVPTSTRSSGIPGTPSGTSVRRAGGNTSGTLSGGLGSTSGYNPAGNAFGQPGVGGTTPFGTTGSGLGGLNTGALGAGSSSAFQNRLSQIVSRAAGAGGIQLLGEVKIIPDERTNSILVFATRADMDIIKEIINKLDVVLAQVLIEALILDVTLGDNFNMSVSAGQQPMGNKTKYGGTANNSGQALSVGNNFLNQVLTTISTNGASNLVAAFPSGSGLNYFGSLASGVDLAFSAVADDNNIKVLARPRIQTSHAVPAQLFVGETRPYVTGTYVDGFGGGGGSRSQYQQTQIGISLNVLPLINQEGLVVMDIQQQVQQVGGSVVIDGNSVPITQDQNASAKVAVRNKETIVLGGFIRDELSEGKSGIPFLKDIPLLGYLFRSTSKKTARRELLVMIRPTVLPKPEDAAVHATEMRKDMPSLRMTERQIQDVENKLQKKADLEEREAAKAKSTKSK